MPAISAKNQYLAAAFGFGFLLMMLTLWVPFIPNWLTFIHMWRVELAASIFLFSAFVIYLLRPKEDLSLEISRSELILVVLPVCLMVVWSAISMFWAPSWRSALHHALLWGSYLGFYIISRKLIQKENNYTTILSIFALTIIIFAIPAIIDYCIFLSVGSGIQLGIRYQKYGEIVIALTPLMIVAVLRSAERRFKFGLVFLAMAWLLVFISIGRVNIFLFLCSVLAIAVPVFVLKKFHPYRLRMIAVMAAIILAPLPLHLFSLLSSSPNMPMVSRFTDGGNTKNSNDFRYMMTMVSIGMFRDKPVLGIGADNFGTQVNKYRALYGEKNPDDESLANAEDELPERSHNEYLQILAELGVIGGSIVVWLLIGIFFLCLRAFRRPVDLVSLAAVIGVAAFLISSLVSSYSFRFIQNGFIFFFVLAVAAKHLFKIPKNSEKNIMIGSSVFRPVCVCMILICLMLAGYSIIRVTSVIFAEKGNTIENLDKASLLYGKSTAIDKENPTPHFYLGGRLLLEKRFPEAVEHLAQTIKLGQGISPTYSYLATAQYLSGDPAAAENTFAEAVKLYPQSTFVLTRYAFFLNINGKNDMSKQYLERAFSIDRASAETWWTMMNDGLETASRNSTLNINLRPVMDLKPNGAIYAVKTERTLRFPEEKSLILGVR